MLTVVETPTFSKLAGDYWGETERLEFITWIANDPNVGDVVRGTGGLRKVRWSRSGSGKRGGVRIIYFNRLDRGQIWLLLIYGKNVKENIPSHISKSIREAIET